MNAPKPFIIWKLEEWARQESNLRLPPCEDGTLAAELRAHQRQGFVENRSVGAMITTWRVWGQSQIDVLPIVPAMNSFPSSATSSTTCQYMPSSSTRL